MFKFNIISSWCSSAISRKFMKINKNFAQCQIHEKSWSNTEINVLLFISSLDIKKSNENKLKSYHLLVETENWFLHRNSTNKHHLISDIIKWFWRQLLKWVRILRNLCLIENCVSLKFEVFINNWFRCNWWFAIRFAWENWHWQATLRSINFLWTIQAFRVRHRPEVRNEIWILSNLISRHLIQLK